MAKYYTKYKDPAHPDFIYIANAIYDKIEKNADINCTQIAKDLSTDNKKIWYTVVLRVFSYIIKDDPKFKEYARDQKEDDAKVPEEERVEELIPKEVDDQLPRISHKDLLLFAEDEIRSPYGIHK